MKRPFIIAEMSGNHNASLERALKIVEAAAECGCSALKIQSYTADSLTINCRKPDFVISDPKSLWYGDTLYDLYQKAATPYEWHETIFKHARSLGLIPFSTPFDPDAVDFLEKLDCQIYKIASFENSYNELLEKVAQTKKPVIISLGLISLEEIKESVKLLQSSGCSDITLLKCTSTYPADPSDSNLATIADLKKRFSDCKIGISDHTVGIGVALAAIGLGAETIEKHFTLSRADGGVDSVFSMEPHEMKSLVEEAQRAASAVGEVHYGPTANEKPSLAYRRSIYVVKDIKAGDEITPDNVRVIRPGFGLHPKYLKAILGKKAKKDLSFGDPLSLDDISELL